MQVVHISQDSFYRDLKGAELSWAAKGLFNFDHPDAFDNALMEKCLRDITLGRTTRIPVYDFKSNCRLPNKFTIINSSQVDVVLFEGILTFYNPTVSLVRPGPVVTLDLGARHVPHEALHRH